MAPTKPTKPTISSPHKAQLTLPAPLKAQPNATFKKRRKPASDRLARPHLTINTTLAQAWPDDAPRAPMQASMPVDLAPNAHMPVHLAPRSLALASPDFSSSLTFIHTAHSTHAPTHPAGTHMLSTGHGPGPTPATSAAPATSVTPATAFATLRLHETTM
ncbi:hypothetical protein CspeluHIS016_0207000 [Cutaneotrichosporon spelunceum]|uniref:Uncharacterized protein n=1 Tax=Cutaneotrichosporon spelunceum TaxID=1672016 RepID=A0AAD3YBC6_9TREE|nr:hypothetical protein CspeluHIS016_0207000 [Cutaneotrichosporon spelunceum]